MGTEKNVNHIWQLSAINVVVTAGTLLTLNMLLTKKIVSLRITEAIDGKQMEVIKIKESAFQKDLKDEIRKRFDGCTILKNDPTCVQGIPDLVVLFGKLWALLEVKKDGKASHRPNQDYYVEKFEKQGFASFIYPENKEEVLDALERYFKES